MADVNEKILKALEALQTDVKDVKQGQGRLGKNQQDMRQDIANVKQTQSEQKTILEAASAGQKELQETVATKADVLTVGVKVDKLRKRIEGIEEQTGSSTHKN